MHKEVQCIATPTAAEPGRLWGERGEEGRGDGGW